MQKTLHKLRSQTAPHDFFARVYMHISRTRSRMYAQPTKPKFERPAKQKMPVESSNNQS